MLRCSKLTLTVFIFTATLLVFMMGCGQEASSALNRGPRLPPDQDAVVPATDADRLAFIRNAASWTGDGMGERTVLEGPLQKKAQRRFSLGQEIRCRFMEPSEINAPNGKTPKFRCDYNGDNLKVKYQQPGEFNSGIWGEVLSTRLFWALGFPADGVYAVKIVCDNCPAKPWRYYNLYFTIKNLEELKAKLAAQGETLNRDKQQRLDQAKRQIAEYANQRQTLTIEDAVVEFKYPAEKIERFADQGWSWSEFDMVDMEEAAGHKNKSERDALALLAAFIQHADNKSEQQRLVCLDDAAEGQTNCDKPVMMIQDLGFTFGSGWIVRGQDPQNPGRLLGDGSTADLKGFSQAPLWSDAEQCITQINHFAPTGMPANKRISEAGRQFLAEKLTKFIENDQNIVDLFHAARIDRLVLKDRSSGETRNYSADQWVGPFKERALKIITHRCPDL